MSITDRIGLTPQLQLAIKLLGMPTAHLITVIEEWRAERPGVVIEVPPGEVDPADELERVLAAEEERPAFVFITHAPLPALGADVWVFGNPPEVHANGRAFPRLKVVSGDREQQRDAAWLIRALRQRAKSYEKVVRGMLAHRPKLAIAIEPTEIEPVAIKDLCEATQMHESTIGRVASACRWQNLHGVFGLEERGTKIAARSL